MASHAKGNTFRRVGPGVLIIAAALSGGCSVLFHADANQCSTNSECSARGPSFASFTCNQGTCVAGVTPDAGHDAAADSGQGGCTAQSQCTPGMFDPQHLEVACDVDIRQCIQLTSAQCPLIIDYTGNFQTTNVPDPLFIGAFLKIPADGTPHPSTLNYQLAINELALGGAGLPIGNGSAPRLPVVIGCSVDGPADAIDGAWAHLINDVHVQSIVAALPSAQLSSGFTNYALTAPSDIFVINPFGADSTLTILPTQGLLWHMLGQPLDNAPAYAAFMPLLENYVRSPGSFWRLGPWSSTNPLKVATVTSNATVTTQLSAAVEKVLTWNSGMNVTQNTTNSNYLAVTVSDSTLNGTPLDGSNDASTALLASIANAASQIDAFHPNVVISYASEEFTTLIQKIELNWNGSTPPPFYLLGPYNEGSLGIQQLLSTSFLDQGVQRLAGIGVASTTDQQVLDDYQNRFLGAYPSQSLALGEENYYDAMYFAVYSLVAAGRNEPIGSDIASGMKKIISLSPPAYEEGPADIGNIVQNLINRSNIELIGTLGPPTFDTATGARVGQGDVYCLEHDVDGGFPYPYDYDVLRLINADGGAPPDGGSDLQGTFPCYPGIQ